MYQKKKLRNTSLRSKHSWSEFLCCIIIIINFICLGIFMGAIPSLAAEISGVVSESGGGALSGITVRIADLNYDFHSSKTTDVAGEYHFDGLASGMYILWVNPAQSGYVAEFYNDAPDYTQAEIITLGVNDVRLGIDFSLVSGKSIRGRVTRQDNGQPLKGIMVGAVGSISMNMGYALADIPDYYQEIGCLGKTINCAFTDSNRIYAICGLSPGKYQIGQLSWPNIFNQYIPEWYEDLRAVLPNVPVVIVGNKLDLEDERKVSTEEGRAFAQSIKASFIETSAKTGTNVRDTFSIIGIGLFFKSVNLE